MTARNAVPFLALSLGSIKAQTRRPDQIVFVDDGSSDDTWACAQELLRDEPSALMVRLPATGRGGALNAAVGRASGEWIANVDADDWGERGWLRVPVLSSIAHYAVLGVGSKLFSDNDELRAICTSKHDFQSIRDVTSLAAYHCPLCHTGAFIRSDALNEVGGYDASRPSMLDYDLWVRLIASGWRLGKLETILCGHRVHRAQNFEQRNRLSYTLASAGVQLRAARTLQASPSAYLAMAGRLAWGMLPRMLRHMVKRRVGDNL